MRKLRIVTLLFLSLFLFACASTDDKVTDATPEVPELTETTDETSDINPADTDETQPDTAIEDQTNNSIEIEAESDTTAETEALPEPLTEIEEPEVQDLPLPEETDDTANETVPETEETETIIEIPEEPVIELEELEDLQDLPQEEENIQDSSIDTETTDNNADNFDDIPVEGTDNQTSKIVRWTEDDTNQETEDNSVSDNTESEQTSVETEEAQESENPEETEIEPEVSEPEIIPSRTVTLNKGETLVVVYPGSGWVYMGSLSEYNNLASKGRKLGATDTKYTLLAKDSGTQIHHFYKEDNLTGQYIDDYLEVVVTTKKSNSKVTVTAPDYSEIVPEKPAKSEAKKYYENLEASETKTTKSKTKETAEKQTTKTAETTTPKTSESSTSFYIQPAESEEQTEEVIEINNNNDDDILFIEEEAEVDTESLINDANTAFANKDYANALDKINQFIEHAEARRDEALYLKGQILEQDSYLKDIKGAVNSYQALIDNYPASSYWNKANKRIIYLKRFYIEVR